MNIILITFDALRADHLSCYGYPRETSPNIDRLANSGVLFRNVMAEDKTTWPNIASLMSSLSPQSHKVKIADRKKICDLKTLPNILRENGYHTGAYSSVYILERDLGLDKCFDEYKSVTIGENVKYLVAKAMADLAERFIEKNKDNKFFLYLHFNDTHARYSPSPRHFKRFLNDGKLKTGKKLKLSESFECIDGIPKPQHQYYNGKWVDDVDFYISVYDAAIYYDDAMIGKIIDKIKGFDLDKKTIIIISSDHGECMGEGGQWFTHVRGNCFGLFNIPLVISHPAYKSMMIHDKFYQKDISPTVLDLLKIKIPREFEGRSMVPTITGNIIESEWQEDKLGKLIDMTKNDILQMSENKTVAVECKFNKESGILLSLTKDALGRIPKVIDMSGGKNDNMKGRITSRFDFDYVEEGESVDFIINEDMLKDWKETYKIQYVLLSGLPLDPIPALDTLKGGV